jgi:hypothetical protein
MIAEKCESLFNTMVHQGRNNTKTKTRKLISLSPATISGLIGHFGWQTELYYKVDGSNKRMSVFSKINRSFTCYHPLLLRGLPAKNGGQGLVT